MQNSLRRGALLMICALSVPLVSATTVAWAQGATAKETGGTLDFDLRDARLEEAVTILTQRSGLDNVVIIPGNYRKITLTLRDKKVDVALRAIALAASAIVEENDGIFYIRPAGQGGALIEPKKPDPAPPILVPTAPALPVRGKRQLAKIELKFLPPSEFKKMVDDPNYDYLVKNVIVPEALRSGQPIAPPNINMVQPPNNALPTENGAAGVGVLGAGQRGGGGFGGGQGQGGFGGGQGGFGGGQGGLGQGGQGGQNQNQRSLRPPGIDNIIASDADNTLIVQGDAGDIDELKALIRLLDVAPKQVEIRAEFVTVNMQDIENFGIQWQFSPANNLDISMAPASGNTPTIAVQYASGNAVASLRAAYVKQTNNVLQAPIISTSNNMPASVFINDLAFVQQSVVIQSALGGQPLVSTQQVPIISSNQFQVTPHINGDGTISMFLFPQLQSFTTAITPGTPPRQTTQGVVTFRRIKSGETMMLGGFITKQEDGGEIKMPILGSLPIIGELFRQRSKTITGVETLIFVTPRIIEENNSTGGGANIN